MYVQFNGVLEEVGIEVALWRTDSSEKDSLLYKRFLSDLIY